MTFKDLENLLKSDGWQLKEVRGSHFLPIRQNPERSQYQTTRAIYQKVR